MRRVLLSSLEGAAVTSLRLVGIEHEFTAIPHLREDMTQLMLNVKQLRLRLHDVESSRIRLHHRGEGTITAADLELPAEVEIINSELLLFTAVADEVDIELELESQTPGAVIRHPKRAVACPSASCPWTPFSAPCAA